MLAQTLLALGVQQVPRVQSEAFPQHSPPPPHAEQHKDVQLIGPRATPQLSVVE
jgi:hypothetical protein